MGKDQQEKEGQKKRKGPGKELATEHKRSIEELRFEDTKSRLGAEIRLNRNVVVGFSLVALILWFFIEFPFIVVILVSTVAATYFLYERMMLKAKSSNTLHNLFIIFHLVDIAALTTIIYYLGGAEWVAPMFYIFTLLLGSMILPLRKIILLSLITLTFFLVLVSLEYAGIIPHQSVISNLVGMELDFHTKPRFLLIQFAALIAIVSFVVMLAGEFTRFADKRREQLLKESERAREGYRRAEEAKETLEVRVKARTQELQELTDKQEDIIKERTEELQKRVRELERFQRAVVGRELKMIDLKKENRRLREERESLEKEKRKA
jgi:hypothetical protein